MAGQLRFGYGFDMRNPPEWFRPWPDFYAETLEFIEHIEQLGFGNIWLAEHHGIDDGYMPSPIVFGAGVATRTKKLRISQGVGLLPHYHPVRLAEDLAVMDILSNGRAEFAMGIGYLPFEAEAYGFTKRGKLSNEIIEIVRRLWQGETLDFDGEFHQLKGARCTPLPCQEGGIPMFVGGVAPAGFRRAAQYGDGFIGPVEYWPQYLEEVKKAGKDEKDARIVSMSYSDMWMMVSEDPEKTVNDMAPHAYYQINTYAEWQEGTDWAVMSEMSLDEFKKSGPIRVMTPDECIAYIKSRQEQAPIEAFCMQVPSGFPLDKMAEHAELFAKKVIPAFRD
ncbi:MAG: LLM class flavin-dependent oxidoreductase [Novosphingobium sp.]|nr:LLM class flavin-dependent oxidoreductase [Novosphingobium sp.]MCP5401405.1 LLM class flavin-dependent oxidoreductase [Novosphingobium sp.]